MKVRGIRLKITATRRVVQHLVHLDPYQLAILRELGILPPDGIPELWMTQTDIDDAIKLIDNATRTS